MDFYYNIYGLRTKCNVAMNLLSELTNCQDYDLEIVVNYAVLPCSDKIKISETEMGYKIVLCSYAHYTVYSNRNKIECIATDFEAFFSTLFNIPFSVYFLLREEVLLHCCAMLHKNQLICFMGEKGVGKSTLTMLLNGEVLKQYSDDTLRISTMKRAFRAHNLVKYTSETVAIVEHNNVTNKHNLSGKTYAYLCEQDVSVTVSHIFAVKRSNSPYFKISAISPLTQVAFILDNIVGIKYFDHKLLKLAINYAKANRFYCEELNIPNGMTYLIQSHKEIVNAIDNMK